LNSAKALDESLSKVFMKQNADALEDISRLVSEYLAARVELLEEKVMNFLDTLVCNFEIDKFKDVVGGERRKNHGIGSDSFRYGEKRYFNSKGTVVPPYVVK